MKLDEMQRLVNSLTTAEVMALEAVAHERVNAERHSLVLLPSEKEMLRENNKMGAIRSVRERFCLGLREAVNFVNSAPR